MPKTMPIGADCLTEFTAVHTSGPRPGIKHIYWIIMHDEESSSARSAAEYFTDRESGGSAHLCVDDIECYRCVANDIIAWGAAGHNQSGTLDANKNGFHIEQAGFAKWSAVIWRRHIMTLRRGAYKAAFHCHKFDIPPRFCNYNMLRQGQKGISTHAEVSKAWPEVAARFGSHHDPGLFWPRTLFMALVKRYYKQIGSEAV